MAITRKTKQFQNLTPEEIQTYHAHFLKWQKSGMNQSSYCKQHDIKYNTFVYVRSKILKQQNNLQIQRGDFIPARTKQPAVKAVASTDDKSCPDKKITIKLPQAIEIELPAAMPAEQIVHIFKTLGIYHDNA